MDSSALLCSYRTNHIRYFDDSLQVASNQAAVYLTNNINMGTPVVYMIYRKRNQMGIRHIEAFWPVGRPARGCSACVPSRVCSASLA